MKHVFIACTLFENGKTTDLVGTGANGELYFRFELSPEVGEELSKKLAIEIIKTKPLWQGTEEAGEAAKDAEKLQLNGNIMLQGEASGYE